MASNEFALNRIHIVLDDSTKFSLMKAQHVIAKEYGFQKWDDLLAATAIQQRLAITMQEHPWLSDFGIGTFRRPGLTHAERMANLKKDRKDLWQSYQEVAEIASWLLDTISPIKTIDQSRTSYRLKHIVERRLGKYITNGQFIAAAIICGYPYKMIPGSPNVHFGMSRKSFNKLDKT